MAEIPFPRETIKTGNAPSPVLDRIQRPSVSADRQVRGIARLADASQEGMIDPDPFVAQSRALSRVGEAVGQAGGIMQAIAHKKKEADDYVNVQMGKASLEDAAIEFDTWKESNRDPSKWGEEWSRRMGERRKAVLENPDLSPEARSQLETTASIWGKRESVLVNRDAAQATFGRAKSAVKASASKAYERGDKEEGDRILQDAVGRSWMQEDEAYHLTSAGASLVEKKQDEATYNANYGTILQDPDGWLAANKGNAQNMDARMYDNLQNQAYQQKRMNQIKVSEGFADAMVTPGAIKSDKDIDSLLAGQRPVVVAKAKADFHKLQEDKVKAYNSSLDGLTANSGRLQAMMDTLDPKAPDAADKHLRMEYLIKSMVPEGYREGLLKDLREKFDPPATPKNPTLDAWGKAQISAWYKDEKLGETKSELPEGHPDREGPIEIDNPGWFNFGSTEIKNPKDWKEDPAKRDRAMYVRGKVSMDWADWQKANPSATMEEGKKALGVIVRDKLKAVDMDVLMKTPTPAVSAGRTAADVLKSFTPLPPAPEDPPGLKRVSVRGDEMLPAEMDGLQGNPEGPISPLFGEGYGGN